MPHICDYEGSDYRDRFWRNADRAYEDTVERELLQKILPKTGHRIVEFGAGFGRLGALYRGHNEVVLFDYSRTLLEQAREQWGSDPRFKYVAGDLYHLPFAPGTFSTATMIRVIHHMADVPAALASIRATLAPGALFVMEFANKRNLKAMLRHAMRRQSWSPYAPEPVEFVKLNFDFHPTWMQSKLASAGFTVERCVPVSHLRIHSLKKILPVGLMASADQVLQNVPLKISPSVFALCHTTSQNSAPSPENNFEACLRSPKSGAPLRREGDHLVCDSDGTRWRVDGNLYDLKDPANR